MRTAVRVIACMFSVVLMVSTAPGAHAFKDSAYVYLPQTGIKLQANAWSQSISTDRRFDWVTSSKTYLGSATKKVNTIKNTATLRAEGINVSVSNGGVSGGAGVSSQVSLSWTNNNAWISDLSGRSGYTGILWRFTVNSAAFATYNGVKKSVDVWSW